MENALFRVSTLATTWAQNVEPRPHPRDSSRRGRDDCVAGGSERREWLTLSVQTLHEVEMNSNASGGHGVVTHVCAQRSALLRNNLIFIVGTLIFAMGGCHGGCCTCHCDDCFLFEDDEPQEEQDESPRTQSNASTGCSSSSTGSSGCTSPYNEYDSSYDFDVDDEPDVSVDFDAHVAADSGSPLDRCRASLTTVYNRTADQSVVFTLERDTVHIIEPDDPLRVSWHELRPDGAWVETNASVELASGLREPKAWAVVVRETEEVVIFAAENDGVQGILAPVRTATLVHPLPGIEYQMANPEVDGELPEYEVLLDAVDGFGSLWVLSRTWSGTVRVDELGEVDEEVNAALQLLRFQPLDVGPADEVFELDGDVIAETAIGASAHRMASGVQLMVLASDGLYTLRVEDDGPVGEWQHIVTGSFAHFSATADADSVFVMLAQPREGVNETRRVRVIEYNTNDEEIVELQEWTIHGFASSLSSYALQQDGDDLILSHVSAADSILRVDRLGSNWNMTRQSVVELEERGPGFILPLPVGQQAAFVSERGGWVRVGNCFGE